MSDSSTLTRCPHCQTRFRVTEQQLGIAAGKVRCGQCMEVFNAREHAVTPGTGSEPPVTPPPSAKPARPEPKPTPAKPAEPPPQKPATSPPPPANSDEDDEFIFQDNPEEDAIDGHYARSTRNSDDFSDSFLALDEEDSFGSPDETEGFGDVDESWAEEMLHADTRKSARPDEPLGPEPLTPPRKPQASAPKPQAEPTPEPKPEPAPRAESFSLSVDSDEIRSTERPPAPDSAPLRAPTSSPYADLRSSPIAAGRNRGGWVRTLFWGLGCLVLLGVIFTQVFWFQFERLSRVEALRPFYALTCPWVGCELPQLVDVGQIESRKLIVRSHPTEPRALLVEANIVNQAPFPQPFPAIVLTFSNLNNDIVAQRAFRPDEYLAGDARGLAQMPEDTPVKIVLELSDPGRDAVNYNLRFLPAPGDGGAVSEDGKGRGGS